MSGIHNAGLPYVLGVLRDNLPNIKVGTGAPPAKAATDLTNPILTIPADGIVDGNVLVQDAYLDENQAVGETLTEVGNFMTDGNIFASGALSFAKTGSNSLTVIVETEAVELG